MGRLGVRSQPTAPTESSHLRWQEGRRVSRRYITLRPAAMEPVTSIPSQFKVEAEDRVHPLWMHLLCKTGLTRSRWDREPPHFFPGILAADFALRGACTVSGKPEETRRRFRHKNLWTVRKNDPQRK